MHPHVIESSYPLSFRDEDAKSLGEHLKNRHCVMLIGMKRVGISNFLRFFLHHKDIANASIADNKNHLFIPVDLNDLVEREIYPFWVLTLKRIVDAVESSNHEASLKKKIASLFLDSIQSQDLFFTIDCVRKSIHLLVSQDIVPTIFFLRFDRISSVVSHQFVANLEGLRDSVHQRLSYVITSFRPLDYLSPSIDKAWQSVLFHVQYIQPGKKEDIETIFNAYQKKYALTLSGDVQEELFRLVDGYTQYLQFALIILHEQKKGVTTKQELFDLLCKDERIALQSEELWESLEKEEQQVLLKIHAGKKLTDENLAAGKYLFHTGMVTDNKIFSPLYSYYLAQKEEAKIDGKAVEFTKKENLLLSFLQSANGEICEREAIIEAVWPEALSLGVSDWAVDRLVARVRNKLKLQKSASEIQTVKTRGYKLVSL